MKTMECLAHGRDNNFNLLRALAAVSVIVSHSWPAALGPWAAEPLTDILHFNLGAAAVKIFFALSGFLVAKSFERRRSLAGFVAARAARLFPALIIVTLVTVLVIGPIFTAISVQSYFSNQNTILFAPRAISLIYRENLLPGLFETTPYPGVNGSLWTLWYEVCCYAGLAITGLIGLVCRGRYWLLLLGFGFAYALGRWEVVPDWAIYANLALPFIFGLTAYVYRTSIRSGIATLLLLVGLALALQAFFGAVEEAWTLVLSYGALWFAGLNIPRLLNYNRVGDFSYGLYLYGWPVQQMLATAFPGISPGAMIALALPGALAFAMPSWFLVERPALARVRKRGAAADSAPHHDMPEASATISG